MIEPIRYPGASYIHALTTGECVRLYIGSHIETHLGRVEFPAGETFGVIYLHCTVAGGVFRFGGQLHDTGRMIEWVAGRGWLPTFPAVSARACYDATGELRDVAPAGYQFLDPLSNQLIQRIYTYGPTNGLSEWCRVAANIYIGQAHDSLLPLDQTGMVVWDATTNTHRMIEPGECTFINADVRGSDLAVSCAKKAEAITYRIRLSDLATFPLVERKTAPPVSVPVPVPPPTPKEPVSMPGITNEQFATLERMRARYPSAEDIKAGRAKPLTPEEMGAILNDTAYVHEAEGLGLQAKPGGTSAIQPGTNLSIWNGIRIGKYGQDVLGAASVGLAIPYRGNVDLERPGDVFVKPVPPITATVPGTPVPGPVSANGAPGATLDVQIAALERKIAVLTARYDELKDLIANIKPTTNGNVTLNGRRIALRFASGKLLCEDRDKRAIDGSFALLANRDNPGEWETMTVVVI